MTTQQLRPAPAARGPRLEPSASIGRGARARRPRLRANAPYILMVAPALAIFAVFFIIPVVRTAVLSLTDQSNHSQDVAFIGLENYVEALTNPQILAGIQHSLLYAVAVVVLQNAIALPVALLLHGRIPFRGGFRTIFFGPAVLSVLVVGYLWSYIFSSNDYGLLNVLLRSVGLSNVNWLGDPDLALGSIIVTQVWQWFGYQMIIYLAALQTINPDLYEAAALDGAGRWRSFRTVTLPGLIPAFQITLVTGLISGLKVFDIVISMTNGGPGFATETVLTLMYRKFSEGNYGLAASFGVLFLIVSLLIGGLLLRLFRRLEAKYS
ncbi:sugar ABC transporter permease [Microbacterium sp. JZ37]|uniref:carbohydrate ABC transporter permease n=1 Tax=Microbacterium sp. JZ37 TaxID=2654193 RepID=UPI002B489F8E|nr:sugar ABC transporter permease [Microbacterium sp. JZ37]WRH16398.1 ABC transporter permease subunit [Microbacterium sp. JZ37]